MNENTPHIYVLTANIIVYEPEKRWEQYTEKCPVKDIDQEELTLIFTSYEKALAEIPKILKQYSDYRIYDVFRISINEYLEGSRFTIENPLRSWVFKHKDLPLERYENQNGQLVGIDLQYRDGDIVEIFPDDFSLILGIIVEVPDEDNPCRYRVVTGINIIDDAMDCHATDMRLYQGWLGAVNFMLFHHADYKRLHYERQ